MTLAMSAQSLVSLALTGLCALLAVIVAALLWSRRIARSKVKAVTFVASYGNDVVTFASFDAAIFEAALNGYAPLASWGLDPETMVRVYLVAEIYPGNRNLNPSEYFS